MSLSYPVPNWQPALHPKPWQAMDGQYIRLEALAMSHVSSLYAAYNLESGAKNWDYLPYGPFATEAEFSVWVAQQLALSDPYFLAAIDLKTGRCIGIASYLRITPEMGVIEVGHIHFSPLLQGTTAATEVMYLMMKWAFDNGYRRYEWKCNALNARSRRAAQRFGFSYEGTFRQALIVKGMNRDTAWFAMLDRQWRHMRKVYQWWLSAENFDDQGQQKCRLVDLTSPFLYEKDVPYKPLNF